MSKYSFLNGFVKATGWLPQLLVFRTKTYYEDKKVQSRRVKGPAVIISNHTSVFDYAAMLFVFFSRTLRYQMAELLFKKKWLRGFLRRMGAIYVDRDAYDFSFVGESVGVLERGGVVGIFPEARLHRQGEAEGLLEFKTSAAYIALESGAPVIPVYTNGRYFSGKRARVIIGTPVYVRDLWDESLDERANIAGITDRLRMRVIELGNELESRTRKKGKERDVPVEIPGP